MRQRKSRLVRWAGVLLIILPLVTSETNGADISGYVAVPKLPSDGGWKFFSKPDLLRGTTNKYALLDSENSLNFGFPYHSSKATLGISYVDGGSALDRFVHRVIISVDGQFVCDESSGDTVKMKFDNEPVREYPCSTPPDGSTDAIYLDPGTGKNSDVLWFELSGKKKMILEALFFQRGAHQLVFNVEGFRPYW